MSVQVGPVVSDRPDRRHPVLHHLPVQGRVPSVTVSAATAPEEAGR